ncbi:MAG: hypothetical protein AAGA25_09660 [Planctomycetota bacterium]
MHRSLPLVLLLFVTAFGIGCSAQRHMERGQAALVSNDPVKARHHFTRALEHDPKLINKPEFAENYRISQRDAAVVEGQQDLRQGRPLDAIERFETALRHHPGWAAADDGLAQARSDAADVYHEQAIQAADRGDLDRARSDLQRALQYIHGHPQATAALASISAGAQAPAEYTAGQNHAANKAWDQALSAYRRSIVSQPNFLPARAAIPSTLDDAARDMLDKSRRLLAEKNYDQAEAAAQRTTKYRPNHADFQPTLGSIDLARGQDAMVADLPGSALLWFRKARGHFAHHKSPKLESAKAGISTASHQLREMNRLTVTLDPISENNHPTAATLADLVQAQLQSREALALSFTPTGQAINVNLTRLMIPPVKVHTEQLEHPYEVHFDVPNPEREEIQHELHEIEACIDDLLIREDRLARRHAVLLARHPHGQPPHGDREFDRVCYDLEQVRAELHDARHDLKAVTHELHDTPLFVTRTRVEHWPYSQSTHERTAGMTVMLTGAKGPQITFSPRVTDSDTTITPANPEIGLPADPLSLLNDAELHGALVEVAAQELADHLSEALVYQRVDELMARSRDLQTTDPIAARESNVAAAVLVAAIDRSRSEKLLDAAQHATP